jgi:hypothetical protein
MPPELNTRPSSKQGFPDRSDAAFAGAAAKLNSERQSRTEVATDAILIFFIQLPYFLRGKEPMSLGKITEKLKIYSRFAWKLR